MAGVGKPQDNFGKGPNLVPSRLCPAPEVRFRGSVLQAGQASGSVRGRTGNLSHPRAKCKRRLSACLPAHGPPLWSVTELSCPERSVDERAARGRFAARQASDMSRPRGRVVRGAQGREGKAKGRSPKPDPCAPCGGRGGQRMERSRTAWLLRPGPRNVHVSSGPQQGRLRLPPRARPARVCRATSCRAAAERGAAHRGSVNPRAPRGGGGGACKHRFSADARRRRVTEGRARAEEGKTPLPAREAPQSPFPKLPLRSAPGRPRRGSGPGGRGLQSAPWAP